MARLIGCLTFALVLLVALNNAPAGDEADKLDVKDVLGKITLTPEKVKAARLEPTSGNPSIPLRAKLQADLQTKEVKPKAVVKKDADGHAFGYGLQYTCDPRNLNCFVVDSIPLTAKQFSYTVDPISWQAGDGWPVYTTFCPNPGYDTSMYYPAAKIHQIVPSITGQNYFVGCLQSGVCASAAAGQICVAVNDNYYPDNRGYFVVTIYGIVP